ncbi:g2282 [Coccomyxa viridis]|uniref:G2282 protein n=1 Tax=Coccomyxa viridis TaxID=1274662 RepID=A0ABP1FQG2_9CHLO
MPATAAATAERSDLSLEVLYRWLLKGAPGVQSLRHTSPDLVNQYRRITAADIDETNAIKRDLITRMLPRLSGFLSPGTDILLDLRWGTEDSIFAMRQGLHTPDFFTQYWGAMSGFLTELKMLFEGAISLETSLALNQLTRLQSLSLEGMGESAAIQLQLPQLKKLTLQDFDNASISLNWQMHLTRSLDHFLDMPQFVYLGLFGDNGSQEELVRWTTDALKFLGLADRRIMATRAKDFTLLY